MAHEERRPKASVACPPHLVDVSDLDPSLPRREVQRYCLADEGFELRVAATLEEGVALDAVGVVVCRWCGVGATH